MWWKILIGIVAAIVIAFLVLLSQVNVTLGIVLHSLFGSDGPTPAESTLQSRLQLPDGFSLGLYAGDVTNARFIEFSAAGDLLVAQPREGTITLLKRDADGNGRADGRSILMSNLNRPHSIDFHEGYLYIAESNAVGRVRFDHDKGEMIGDYAHVITELGDEGNHWTKSIRFGPDNLLYLSSGSTCNVCVEEDPQRATIYRYQADGSDAELVAGGLRNAVGFDWDAKGDLYATDNGRDLLGDDYPPCELNRVEAGEFYGWPYINGFGDKDPDFGDAPNQPESTSPVHGFRAHNAPLGIRFIDSSKFPERYQGAALVALHGSWNRSTYDGYKVVSLIEDGSGGYIEEDFLSGFEQAGEIIGRPVDVAAGPDDCAYISDDYGSAIYRVCYGETQQDAVLAEAGENLPTGLEDIDANTMTGLVKRGERLYQTRGCVACHVIGEQDAPFGLRPLVGLNDRYNRDSLATFFKTPTPPMPPVRLGSTDDELALIAYLLTLEDES